MSNKVNYYQLNIDIINLLIDYVPSYRLPMLIKVPMIARCNKYRQLMHDTTACSANSLANDAIVKNDIAFCKQVFRTITDSTQGWSPESIYNSPFSPYWCTAIKYERINILDLLIEYNLKYVTGYIIYGMSFKDKTYDDLFDFKPNTRILNWLIDRVIQLETFSRHIDLFDYLISSKNVELLEWLYHDEKLNGERLQTISPRMLGWIYHKPINDNNNILLVIRGTPKVYTWAMKKEWNAEIRGVLALGVVVFH
jgi:hypothetical protein